MRAATKDKGSTVLRLSFCFFYGFVIGNFLLGGSGMWIRNTFKVSLIDAFAFDLLSLLYSINV